MLQHARVVIEPEEQGADRILAGLVPAKPGDDALRRARMLDLDHRALARLVRRIERLGKDPVEPGPLEALEPVHGDLPFASSWRELHRRADLREQLLKLGAAIGLRL